MTNLSYRIRRSPHFIPMTFAFTCAIALMAMMAAQLVR